MTLLLPLFAFLFASLLVAACAMAFSSGGQGRGRWKSASTLATTVITTRRIDRTLGNGS